jgi:hypothetical protein
VGRIAQQSIKHIEAPRVYILANNTGVTIAESLTAFPVSMYATKSNGTTPTPGNGNTWLDLGIIDGQLKITYQKKTKDVRTGIDQVLRAQYVNEKTCVLEGSFTQFSDYVLEKATGLTASVLQSGSIISYGFGQEDLNIVGLLFVTQNKLDGVEWQFINPAAYVNFELEQKSDQINLKLTATCPWFTCSGQSNQEVLRATLFE